MGDLFPFNILNFSWNRIGKKIRYIIASCLQKDLPNYVTAQPYRHGWNMACFTRACIVALGLTALLCVLIFLLFYCCEAATLLKIQLMLQDTLVDSRNLCKKQNKGIHLKMI